MGKRKRVNNTTRRYKCTWTDCKKDFISSYGLKLHMMIHTNTRPFPCTFDGCSDTFITRGNLVSHERVHTKDRPYACDVKGCGATFTQACALKGHQRIHSGERPWSCTVEGCGDTFSDLTAFKRHALRHLGIKPHVCSFDGCSSAFTSPSDLRTHEKTHTGIRPFSCTFQNCVATFTQKAHLKKHVVTHTGVKAFHCGHCGKQFAHSSNLRAHEKLHELQSTFTVICEYNDCSDVKHVDDPTGVMCSIRCKTALKMEYHIQHHHTAEGIQAKFESETQLARFFDAKGVSYDRDWANNMNFKSCKAIEGKRMSARPDFYLHELSAKLSCIFLLGNDEFAHRQYACDFQRIFNIANALQQTKEFRDLPIVYMRFNPHHFHVGKTLFDVKLEISHSNLWSHMNSLTPQDVKPGVNLFYEQYDRDDQGNLTIFTEILDGDDEADAHHYRDLYRSCVRGIW